MATTNMLLLAECARAYQYDGQAPSPGVKATLGARIAHLPDGLGWHVSDRDGRTDRLEAIPRSADFPDPTARLEAFAQAVAALTVDGHFAPALEPVYEPRQPVHFTPSAHALEAFGSVDGVDVHLWVYHPETPQPEATATVAAAIAARRGALR